MVVDPANRGDESQRDPAPEQVEQRLARQDDHFGREQAQRRDHEADAAATRRRFCM